MQKGNVTYFITGQSIKFRIYGRFYPTNCRNDVDFLGETQFWIFFPYKNILQLWWQRNKNWWIALYTFLSDTAPPPLPPSPSARHEMIQQDMKFCTITNCPTACQVAIIHFHFEAYSFHQLSPVLKECMYLLCKYFLGVFTFQTREVFTVCHQGVWITFGPCITGTAQTYLFITFSFETEKLNIWQLFETVNKYLYHWDRPHIYLFIRVSWNWNKQWIPSTSFSIYFGSFFFIVWDIFVFMVAFTSIKLCYTQWRPSCEI